MDAGLKAMRKHQAALFSGIGRRVAFAVAACLLLVLAAITLVIARANQQQFRQQLQHSVDQSARQTSLTLVSRLASVDTVLQSLIGPDQEVGVNAARLRAQLNQTGLFRAISLVKPDSNDLVTLGQRRFQITAEQRSAIESGRGIRVSLPGSSGQLALYMVRAVRETGAPRLLLAELTPDWVWMPLRALYPDFTVVVLNTEGGHYFSGVDDTAGEMDLFRAQAVAAVKNGAPRALAWHAGNSAWVGSVAMLPHGPNTPETGIALVVAGSDVPWSSHLLAAIKSLLPVAILSAMLAVLAGMSVAQLYVPVLRRLRRALVQMPEHLTQVPHQSGQCAEVRLLVDAYNHSAENIHWQRVTQRALSQIDGMLIGSGEFEKDLDQVLARIREVTLARGVGLTLIDADAPGHGRLFAVSNEGGFPVNRVTVDPLMAATLRESRAGLTIVRCEEIRHSFLAPMQTAGAEFFWVWPVMVGERLAAILAVGYAEAPAHGARVAGCGTHCAQRLGASLSSSARSDQLYRQAHFDPLTQLPNRLLFRDRLEQEIVGAANSTVRGALLYIDLDHFKKVNDSLGHEAGDQLLSVIAQRLRSCVKDGDTVARLGGDEFTVILRQVNEPNAASVVADRIIQSLQLPVSLGGRDHHVRASIGITLFPDDGATLDELLHNADLAMYRAKDLGRGTAVFYEAKLAVRGTRAADSGLYRALKRREFSLFYQPQYSITDGRLLGIEALVRWQTPRDGMKSPAEFIPAAEESGLIVDLGGWVLETACSQVSQWREQMLDPPRVSINLSVQQLRDPGLTGSLRRLLERYRVPASQLDFELTEAALTDTDSQDTIRELAEMGAGLILDDFGTGHTALNNLRRYPVRAVKIDRSFIDEIAVNPASAALAETIVVMAHALGKQVVAEGVETIEQLEFLRERGCDIAQGFYLARPLPVLAMTELLMGRQPQVEVEEAARA
jgi:diguanylate cyclase (GGDEF)-like protein